MNEQKDVLRLVITRVLLLGLFGLVADAQETQQQVERLIKQSQDQDPEVRAASAITLGQIGKGTVDAVDTLIQALQDQNKDVRGSTVEALGKIGEDAVPA